VEESYTHFSNLPDENKAIADEFVLKVSATEDDKINWQILPEAKQITECLMEKERVAMEDCGVIKKDVPWDPDPRKVDYNSVLLNHFFPSLVGNAKVLNESLSLVLKNLEWREKELIRPSIAHMLYEFLLLTDEHNKA
jgi:hypothetical protein